MWIDFFFLPNHYHIFVNICEYYSTVKKMRVNSQCIMNEVTQSKHDKTHAISFIHYNIFVCIYYVNTVQ